MQTAERVERILERVHRDGRVYTAALATEYGVSEETIRRDIRALAREGKLKRVHGGATRLQLPSSENAYAVRRLQDAEEKRRIGEYAAGLVGDGDIIAMDDSCCAEQLALALSGQKNLIAVTNFLSAAAALSNGIQQGRIAGRVVLLGGEMNCENLAACGAITEDEAARYRFTRAFIGASALSENGAMVWNLEEGRVSRRMAERASGVVLLCESAKFTRTSLYQYIDYSDVDMLITDDTHEIPRETLTQMQADGVEIIVLGEKKA